MIKSVRLTKNQAALIKAVVEVQINSYRQIYANVPLLEDFVMKMRELQPRNCITLTDAQAEIDSSVALLKDVIKNPKNLFQLPDPILSTIKHVLSTVFDREDSGFSKKTRASIWRLLLVNEKLGKSAN